MKTFRYKVVSSPCDDPYEYVTNFFCTSDEDAIKLLNQLRQKPSNAWYDLVMYRIEAEEQKTLVK